MPKTAIKIQHLTKIYKLYDRPIDRLKESLHPFKKQYHKDFYALNDVSFEIKKGETVGIIGKNGAGKSTLLKIITGVLTPTNGSIHVNGRIASLLELGAGFNPDYTGIENIYFQGMLMGLTREEMEAKIDDILAFADIGDFVHQSVKMYSSGMFARLAFAVAINVDPDILIVDEALSVGDIRFQQKCYRKFREFQGMNKTILFVTHDIATILNYCSHVMWINDGCKVDEGAPASICKKYTSLMAYNMHTVVNDTYAQSKSDSKIFWENVSSREFFGEGSARISDVAFCDNSSSQPLNIVTSNQMVDFYIKFKIIKKIYSPGIGLRLTDELGNHIFSITSYVDQFEFGFLEIGSIQILKITFQFPKIRNGKYLFTIAIADGTQENHVQLHWVNDALEINVLNEDHFRYKMGIISIDTAKYEISKEG